MSVTLELPDHPIYGLSDAELLTHLDEITAAVQEARAFGTYVLAHCHTSAAMRNALDAGVRSIEHGLQMDAETATWNMEQGWDMKFRGPERHDA